jgi:hypothetical protein
MSQIIWRAIWRSSVIVQLKWLQLCAGWQLSMPTSPNKALRAVIDVAREEKEAREMLAKESREEENRERRRRDGVRGLGGSKTPVADLTWRQARSFTLTHPSRSFTRALMTHSEWVLL